MDLDLPQPVSADMYYATCSAVDWTIRRSCDDIKLENNFGTHSWDNHINMSIFGAFVVDTYSFATQSLTYEDTSRVFFFALYEEMINNNIDSRPIKPPSNRTGRIAYPVCNGGVCL